MDELGLGLFAGKDEPTVEWGWSNYTKGVDYNLEVADMNEDNEIAQDDLQELVNLVLRSTVTPAPAS